MKITDYDLHSCVGATYAHIGCSVPGNVSIEASKDGDRQNRVSVLLDVQVRRMTEIEFRVIEISDVIG